ncbi:hypothetical protein I5535_03890 [Rhodobacteraceae bacterium F11138]|nr:hypothetical protein [Rhodobacteraceae bacterium F11138]
MTAHAAPSFAPLAFLLPKRYENVLYIIALQRDNKNIPYYQQVMEVPKKCAN